MESSLRNLFFGIGAVLLVFVGLVIAAWVSWRRGPPRERVVEPDAPGILSVAMFGLELSRSSEPLFVFKQLLEAVAAEGVRFGEPMVKEWGLLSVGGPFVLELRALGEGTWRLALERSGGRPLTGSDITLQVLALLQSQLQALPAFTGVTWVKRDAAKVPGT